MLRSMRRMERTKAWLAVLLVLVGCAASQEPRARSPRLFSGWMLVDQPGHAGYEASLYEFRDDGTIALDATYVSRGGAYERAAEPIGVVAAGEIRCAFGDRYDSAARVTIEGECTDGRTRPIVLEVAAGPDEHDRLAIDIVSVGGAPGWTHPGHAWSFRRCASRSSCLDFLDP